MSKLLVIGNWKMGPSSLKEARKIMTRVKRRVSDLHGVEAVICPPLPLVGLSHSRHKAPNYHIGAQDVSAIIDGPYTGETSAAILHEVGVEYVIVGHSERRGMGETDSVVAKKINAVLENGMTPIVCVGEAKREEDGSHYEVIKEQIKNSLTDIPKKYSREIVIAYEPIWAIGAQESMLPEQICEMALFVRKTYSDIFGQPSALKMKVLYGGSVNFRNAYEIISVGKVDGLLVGRESVNAVGFVELLKVVGNMVIK